MATDHADEPVGAPGGRGAGAPLDLATMGPPGSAPGQASRNPNAGAVVATLPPSQTPRDQYDLAYGYILRKDYALAEDGFRSFLSRYPGDRLTSATATRRKLFSTSQPNTRLAPRRRRRSCGLDSRLPRSARRKRRARRSAKSCVNFRVHRRG
jgi:hypothetical protein